MSATHDDNATTWRDLADQLTPEQVAELEYCEREDYAPDLASPGNHLNHARKLVELNLARAMYADVAPPAEAIGEVDQWTDIGDDEYQRQFTSWRRQVDDASVEVFGLQSHDGRIDREIVIDARGCYDASTARQIAAALVEAADELDRLQ